MGAPQWTVINVFDPDGSQPDFGYTVGLHRLGHPELHLWAQPSDGQDPGEDWKFSPSDRGHLLNGFARDLLAGDLAPGTIRTQSFDGGAATVTFTVGDAVEPATVEAFQVDDGASVLPIRWALHRAPEGRLEPLTAATEAELRRRYGADYAFLPKRALTGLPAPFTPPAPADVSFSVDQPYGPATALVRLRAAQVLTADADTLADFAHNVLLAGRGISPQAVLAVTRAAARPVGRTVSVDATTAYAGDVLDELTGGDRHTARWREVLIQLGANPDDPLDYAQMAQAVERMVHQAIAATLTAAVVCDQLSAEDRAAADGPLVWAVAGSTFEPPLPLWAAPDPVVDTMRRLVADAGDTATHALATAHRAMLAARDVEDDPMGDVYWWCRAQAVTSPVSLPPLGAAAGPLGMPLAAHAHIGEEEELARDALQLLTVVLALRDDVAPERRTRLVALYGAALPGLADQLTEPAQPR